MLPLALRKACFQARRRNLGNHFGNTGNRSRFDFEGKCLSDSLQAAGGGMHRFCDEVKCTEGEGFQGLLCALVRMSAEKDYGYAVATRDLTHHFDAVHTRHFEVERDHVWLELLDFLQAE